MRFLLSIPAHRQWLDLVRGVATRMALAAGFADTEAAEVAREADRAASRAMEPHDPASRVDVELRTTALELEVAVCPSGQAGEAARMVRERPGPR